MLSIDGAPDVAEIYMTACNSRRLVVESRRGGAADALIAAGAAPRWSRAHFGMALLRLRSEWDALHGARAPRRQHAQADGANAAGAAHARLPRMRSLPELHAQLVLEATRLSISEPALKSAQVLAWWLRPACPTCSGRRWNVVDGTPSLSGVRCRRCRGHGELSVPCGADGRQLAAFIDDCLDLARNTLWLRLRARLQRA